jgi:fructose-1-phosphate kinase PfkB-like protein
MQSLYIDIPTEALKTYPIKGAYLLKPNLNELSMLAGKEELQEDEIEDVARIIISRNVCEVIVYINGVGRCIACYRKILLNDYYTDGKSKNYCWRRRQYDCWYSDVFSSKQKH